MKKFLSLALSLVMVFSLFTFVGTPSAEALKEASKSYTDYNTLSGDKYKEAVDVITALEIMGGYNAGTFGPTGGLTRGAATKIVCGMLVGPATASRLPTPTSGSFTDVPADHTFAATIGYCAEQGFISGYSDGSFHPGDPLSGNAFLKMLLCALGYDQDLEHYRNTSSWATNVVSRASTIGLANYLPEDFDGRLALTREQAALLAFNCLQCDLVEYPNKIVYIVDGQPQTVSGTAQVRTANTSYSSRDYISSTSGQDGNSILQFAELYFNMLERIGGDYKMERTTSDAESIVEYARAGDYFGRPSTTWYWKGEKIGTYEVALSKTYYGGVKLNQIFTDLGMTSGDSNASVYINGLYYGGVTVGRSNDVNLKDVSLTRYNTNGERDSYDSLLVHLDNGSSVRVQVYTGYRNNQRAYYYPMIDLREGRPVYVDGDDLICVDENGDYYYGNEYGTNINGYIDEEDNVLETMVRARHWLTDAERESMSTFYPSTEGSSVIGDGTRIEVYRDKDTNHVTICIISVYGGKIDAVKNGNSTKGRYVIVEYDDVHRPDEIDQDIDAYDGNDEFETTDFQEGDYVAYTFSERDDEIEEMYLLTEKEGRLTSRISGKSLTIGGTKYTYAKEYAFEGPTANFSETSLTNNWDYNVYLDNQGYALWIKEADFKSINEYALLTRISIDRLKYEYNADNPYDSSNRVTTTRVDDVDGVLTYGGESSTSWSGNMAHLVFADGTERNVELDKSYTVGVLHPTGDEEDLAPDSTFLPKLLGTQVVFPIVRFSVSNGVYRLRSVKAGSLRYGTDFVITNNRNVSINGEVVNTDSNTRFVVTNNEGGYKVYTGIRNAPTIDEGTVYAFMNNNLAKLIYVTQGVEIRNTSRNVTFFAAKSASDLIQDSDYNYNYYTMNAVVGGQIKEVLIRQNANISGIQNRITESPEVFENMLLTPLNAETRDDWFLGTDKNGVNHYLGVASHQNSTIVNDITYNNDDVITAAVMESPAIQSHMSRGIRKTGSYEIKVGTYNGTEYDGTTYEEQTRDVSSLVNVYYINGDGDITRLENLSAISNDSNDWVFYTLDDDAYVTNLFICAED